MTNQLDVLLLDDRADTVMAERVLQEAGHRVHRCRPVGDGSFACDGIRENRQCPLDGPIDVALVTRHEQGTAMPDGTRCALRQGVPIVEQGNPDHDDPGPPDPYASLIAHRVRPGESIVSVCVGAADAAKGPLAGAVTERIRPVLDAARISIDTVDTRIEWNDTTLVVQVTFPGASSPRLEQAVAVRVLDAVRASPRTYGQVNVRVRGLGSSRADGDTADGAMS